MIKGEMARLVALAEGGKNGRKEKENYIGGGQRESKETLEDDIREGRT